MKRPNPLLAILNTWILISGCLSDASYQFQKSYSNGRLLYRNHCENCHGKAFQGFASLYPPILDSFLYDPSTFCTIIQKGYKKPLIVHQDTYKIPMPPIPEIKSKEMAYLLTYLYKEKLNKDTLFHETDFTNCGLDFY